MPPLPAGRPLGTLRQDRNSRQKTHTAVEDRRDRFSTTGDSLIDPPSASDDGSEDEADPDDLVRRSRTRRRPPMMVDWRSELCSFLEMPTTCTDDDILEELEAASERQRAASRLISLVSVQQGPPRLQVMYRIGCEMSHDEDGLYLDKPWVVESGPHQAHLRGSKMIQNLELYRERNKDITCIVYHNYKCCGSSPPVPNPSHSESTYGVDPASLFVGEYVSIVSDELKMALAQLANGALQGIPHPNFEGSDAQHIAHPYLWWFHRREDIQLCKAELDPASRHHIDVLQAYLENRLGQEWAVVDALVGKKRITAQFLEYVFVPDEIVISRLEGNSAALLQAFATTGWLEIDTSTRLDEKTERSTKAKFHASIKAAHWVFDGNFQRVTTLLDLPYLPSLTKEFSINDMPVYPMRYANDDMVLALRERGNMFWRCRHRNYVRSVGSAEDGLYGASDSRFMIDTAVYKQMHPSEGNESAHAPYRDDLGPEAMAQDDPLPDLKDAFFMCLPTTLSGFNMQKKEWVSLEVGLIEEVKWNEEAFDLLVMEPGTKELVEAVVTNHVYEDRSADVIRGKGNGLFILLHGGPGTGKTLTAESVAEIAKKPLYRVTCGDIGTKADEVERYLEVVLLLGKTWGCVVLLDEADVFLEQRKLDNLDRNALVSVFLRVLEYYDGILILTSNRVGIFDEAFKSRIQLNLRYKNLDREQRRQIWENFINRLERLELERDKRSDAAQSSVLHFGGPQSSPRFGVDIKGMREGLEKLSGPPLNGREIRNAISTARQLATFHKEKLGLKHLNAVIAEANKFEEYLKTVKKGFSADQIKNAQQER